jgi:hypothetical protein
MERPDTRQAITTVYVPYTSSRTARVLARASAGGQSLEWDDNLHMETNHLLAATALANKYGWLEPRTVGGKTMVQRLVGGGTHRGEFVWVLTEEEDKA